MFHIILSFFLAFLNPSHSDNGNHYTGDQVTTFGDTAGETGTIPPRIPPRKP